MTHATTAEEIRSRPRVQFSDLDAFKSRLEAMRDDLEAMQYIGWATDKFRTNYEHDRVGAHEYIGEMLADIEAMVGGE